MKKILFLVLDGLGDDLIPSLGDKTPLEAADTPNLDILAKKGVCGLLEPYYSGVMPTSEEGHYSLFGCDPKRYKIKRGVVTALGAGINLEAGDISFRGNFATIDNNFKVIDRRAGRIKDTKEIVSSLNKIELNGAEIIVKGASGHRIALVLRGEGLSSEVSDGDPHYKDFGDEVSDIVPLDKSKEALLTAKIINSFLEKSHTILKSHYKNKDREDNGLLPANYILLRGASSFVELPSFLATYGLKACCIAGKNLYKSIATSLGMDILNINGADGTIDTNIGGMIQGGIDALNEGYNFAFIHFKATDTLAEDGDYLGKKKFIEKIDKQLELLLDIGVTVVVTSDHSTSSLEKSHSPLPIPFLIFNNKIAPDKTQLFSEKECKKGALGLIPQMETMLKIQDLS